MAEGNAVVAQNSNCGDGGKQHCYYSSYHTLNNEFYNMDHKYRGKALIFSHDVYDIKGVKQRKGNVKDWQRMEKCLKDLSFSVDIFPNLKYEQIMKQIEQTAKMDHSENDCLLIAVFTHGESDAHLLARDAPYRAEELWCQFTDKKCPTLAGKPRLFVIQACQGDNYDDGITLTNDDTETDGWFEPHRVPVHPDFLVALSAVPGYYSWRSLYHGSWFIQTLCEQLEISATEMDIMTLFTFVNQKVALNFESSTENPHQDLKKEVPYISSMLTRRLLFTKKHKCENNDDSTSSNFANKHENGNSNYDRSLSASSSSSNSFVEIIRQCFPFR